MVTVEPSIFDELGEVDAKADALRLAEAEADIAAGRLIAHEDVAEWLKTWGAPDEKPAPESWFK